jgi:Ohr subfamily peroxiredoxin
MVNALQALSRTYWRARMKPMYTAVATASGGRQGTVVSDDGRFEARLAMPTSMGGTGDGTNPEQLFAAGYAACFQSAMLFVAGQKKINAADCTVTGHVSIGAREDGPGFALAVRHEVSLPHLSQADAEALVHEAHQVCPYSNATRNNIPVEFSVRGGA